MKINFDQNWFDVMRQIIDNAVAGKYKCQTSIHKDGKQYAVTGSYTIKELQFEKESEFVPMQKGGK